MVSKISDLGLHDLSVLDKLIVEAFNQEYNSSTFNSIKSVSSPRHAKLNQLRRIKDAVDSQKRSVITATEKW